MFKAAKIFLFTVLALALQVTVFPVYIRDPFKPNLMIVLIAYLALRGNVALTGGLLAYCLGLVQDCYSGIYLGLNGFTFLFIYMFLRKIADQLYTDSNQLMVMVVFLATLVAGLLQLLLLILFSAAAGIYASLVAGLIPQALINSLAASLLFGIFPAGQVVEGR